MFRNLNHIFAQLKIRKFPVVKKTRRRVQTQSKNLKLHFSAPRFPVWTTLPRPQTGRGLRTRPDCKLIYDNNFKPKGQEFKCPRVNNNYLARRNPKLRSRTPGSK